MLQLKEAIIVEGKYDKAKLSTIVDCLIIETSGFGIFKDKKKLSLIRKLAETRGIIVLTDSDASGFMIRNYIKTSVQTGVVKHAYIPNILGKERRKDRPSKEGMLGVEGMTAEVILNALKTAKASSAERYVDRKITKQDLYQVGLSGQDNSKAKRKKLLKKLDLPEYISTNELVRLLNAFWSYDDFKQEMKKLLCGE